MPSALQNNNINKFFDFLESWQQQLPVVNLLKTGIIPDRTAIVSVDVLKGFCSIGPLSSPRVARIVPPIRKLFVSAWEYGIRNILLIQDTHEPDAVEFANYPPHCIRGSEEAETVDEFKSLPFFDQFLIFPKNSISSDLNTGFDHWRKMHPQVDTFIVVGDCTDLCTYQLTLHLRMDANAHQKQRRVILPANCTDTYDMPLETAINLGIFAHPADLIHPLFLYHIAMNGVEVVAAIE
jgi:nicotinamidase-related amidase